MFQLNNGRLLYPYDSLNWFYYDSSLLEAKGRPYKRLRYEQKLITSSNVTKLISNIDIPSSSPACLNGSVRRSLSSAMHVCLVAGSAIRAKEYMPRRLPEKDTTRRPKRASRAKRQRKYQLTPFQRAPVKAGEELDVVIDDIGSRGDGITRVRGFLVFVPQTKVGERLKVKITSVGRKFAIAEKLNETGGKSP